MPFTVEKQDCTQSDGTKGSYIIKNTDTGEQKSCHKTKEDAQKALAVLQQETKDENRKILIMGPKLRKALEKKSQELKEKYGDYNPNDT